MSSNHRFVLEEEIAQTLIESADSIVTITLNFVYGEMGSEYYMREYDEQGTTSYSFYSNTSKLIEVTEEEYYNTIVDTTPTLTKTSYKFWKEFDDSVEVSLDKIVRLVDISTLESEVLYLLNISSDNSELPVLPEWLQSLVDTSPDVSDDVTFTDYGIGARIRDGKSIETNFLDYSMDDDWSDVDEEETSQ